MLLSEFTLLTQELSKFPKTATSVIEIIQNNCKDNNFDLILIFLDGVICFIPLIKGHKINLLAFRGSRKVVYNIGEDIIKIIKEADLPSFLENKKVFENKVKDLKKEANSTIKSYIESRARK